MSFFARLLRSIVGAALLCAACAGCAGTNVALPPAQIVSGGFLRGHAAYSVGPTVSPKVPGTILGFDIDQNGTDGVLADCCGRTLQVSLETFDQRTGKITKVVGKGGENASYAVDGILAHDIGFIDHNGYELMNPVTGEKLNGTWTPPASFSVWQIAENQSTSLQAILGFSPSGQTSVAAVDVLRKTAKVIALNQLEFGIGAVPVIAEDSATNQAVVAANDGSLYTRPNLDIIDLRSGKSTVFQGIGYGSVNGIGIDSKTDTAATTTNTDAGIEFYNLKTQASFEVNFPNSGSDPELHSGSGLAMDPVNGLCIVGQPVSGGGTQASAIWVVDEKGDFLDEIAGFDFWWDDGPLINPNKRIGFIANPRPAYATLTGFSY
jgi:hypothetical protein